MKSLKRLVAVLVSVGLVTSSFAQEMGKGGSEITGAAVGEGGAAAATPQLERCGKKLGTIAVVEPQDFMMKALAQYSLPSPTQMIRLVVQQSGCFAVVERGLGMQNLAQERALADGGQMRQGQNMGRGQMVTADYVMTPDVMFNNGNAGGLGGIGAIFGPIGAVIGGAIKFKTAQVTLTMADTRSSLQVAATTGSSQATDFGIGGLVGGSGGSLGLGAYENTAQGKVVAMAFLDAYNQMVRAVRENSELARDNGAVRVARAGRDSVANQRAAASSGDLGRAKIAGIAVFKTQEGKGEAFKLKKGEEVVILTDGGAMLEVQAERGIGWVDGRLLAR